MPLKYWGSDMTIKQILSITIDILTEAKEKSPNRQVAFPVDDGTQKIPIDAAIAQVKNLYSWCYDQLELKNIIKICRCKDCKYYRRYRKKDSLKKVYKMLCSLDKTERPPEWYCPKGTERSKENDCSN